MTQITTPRPLVMIVDDDTDALEMNAAFLQTVGFDTCTTSAALHAIEMAVTRRPDAIVTDLSMPFVDGWTILRTLQEHPLTKTIPIVLITGYADVATRQRAATAGCHAFLAKPCRPDLLVDTLRSLLPVTPSLETAG